jgi:hypothetical protein
MLFAWSKTGHHRATRARWPCRICAGLDYASEGRYRTAWHRRLGPLRRQAWYPDVHVHEGGLEAKSRLLDRLGLDRVPQKVVSLEEYGGGELWRGGSEGARSPEER